MEKWQNPQTIAFWIVIACVVVFSLSFLIVRLFQLRYKQVVESELDKAQQEIVFREQLLDLQEKERVRFGADLHDNLISKLLITQFKLQLSDEKQEVSDLLTDIIADARRISHDLSPPMIDQIPLDQLIMNVLTMANNRFSVTFESDLRNDINPPVSWKMHLLRIIQEVIANSMKHSQASELRLRLRVTDHWFSLSLSDNGKGFDAAPKTAGIGMNNMSLRSREIKAVYKFKSVPGKGVTFLLLHSFYS
ncbi:Sensor histidine kinase ComP [compost metagenome]